MFRSSRRRSSFAIPRQPNGEESLSPTASTVSLVSTVERDWSARLPLEVAILRNREQPHNEELQLTKGSAWAAFAAELRCCADAELVGNGDTASLPCAAMHSRPSSSVHEGRDASAFPSRQSRRRALGGGSSTSQWAVPWNETGPVG
jgi:hypothetical protein